MTGISCDIVVLFHHLRHRREIGRAFGHEYLLKLYVAGALGGSVFYLAHQAYKALTSEVGGVWRFVNITHLAMSLKGKSNRSYDDDSDDGSYMGQSSSSYIEESMYVCFNASKLGGRKAAGH
ncbi:hypothetical protein K1719_019561 [Acacia pycnantha]|nr:hypothetical protein K1719_019561 [Acacia pycnantha]